jgi:hypothetical protein
MVRVNPKKHKEARRKRGSISKPGELVQASFWFDGYHFIPEDRLREDIARTRGFIFRKQTIVKLKA